MVRTTADYRRGRIREMCKDQSSTCCPYLDASGKRLRLNVGRSWVLVEG